MRIVPRAARYTMQRLAGMLGLPRSTIHSLVEAGFVTPERGARNEWRFSFQDVVMLRTAHRLREAGIPARKVVKSLQQLRAKLPEEAPLSGLRVTAVGNEVAVHEGGAVWDAVSGQRLFDFEVAPDAQGAVAFIERPAAGPPAIEPSAAEPADWYAQAVTLEPLDRVAAEQAYRRAIALEASRSEAWINLGVLVADGGRHAEAVAVYDEALKHCPREPLLHFNRAVALEDLGRPYAALEGYAECLSIEPQMADAHYNVARLFEQIGQAQRALKHYSTYRRLQRR